MNKKTLFNETPKGTIVPEGYNFHGEIMARLLGSEKINKIEETREFLSDQIVEYIQGETVDEKVKEIIKKSSTEVEQSIELISKKGVGSEKKYGASEKMLVEGVVNIVKDAAIKYAEDVAREERSSRRRKKEKEIKATGIINEKNDGTGGAELEEKERRKDHKEFVNKLKMLLEFCEKRKWEHEQRKIIELLQDFGAPKEIKTTEDVSHVLKEGSQEMQLFFDAAEHFALRIAFFEKLKREENLPR